MIKRITFTFMALLAYLSMQAEAVPATAFSEFAAGTTGNVRQYYLYNLTTEKFLNTADRTLSEAPATVTFTCNEDNGTWRISGASGKYLKLGTYKGQYLWSDGDESATGWTIAEIEGETNVYTIAGLTGNYTETAISGDFYITGTNASNAEDAASNSRWAFVTETAYEELQNAAYLELAPYLSGITAGTFYLYNMDEKKFLNGTPAMSATPAELTITTLENGQYSIQSGNYLKMGVYKGQYLWNNSWEDTEYFKWNFDASGTNTYNLSVSVVTENTEDGYTFTVGKHYLNTVNSVTTTESEAHTWVLITKENWESYQATLNTFDEEEMAANLQTIQDAKGDATALIKNPSFTDDGGWSGGTRTGCQLYRGAGYDYESEDDNATFTQTLYNMPAGTYKLVAAVRGAIGTTATAKVAGTSGETVTNYEFTAANQFNTNGVLMPKSELYGFNTTRYSLGWNWATATGTLSEAGELTIEFVMTGSAWKGIADVHLYYMNDTEGTAYAVEYTDGVDAANHAVTCDLVAENPNQVFTSTAPITTVCGEPLNNNLVDGIISNLVVYDGYDFDAESVENVTNATYTRQFETTGTYGTIILPFTPDSETCGNYTFYKLANSNETALIFEEETEPKAHTAYLYTPADKEATVHTFTGSAANASYGGTTESEGWNFIGTFAKSKIEGLNVSSDAYYAYRPTDGKDVLVKATNSITVYPYRAYFKLIQGINVTPASVTMRMVIGGEGGAMGIEKTLSPEQAKESIYDRLGRPVKEAHKGQIYIINGKKVMK